MIRRPPRSTQGVSSAASDVYKRQGLTLLIFDTEYLMGRIFGWTKILTGYTNTIPVTTITFCKFDHLNILNFYTIQGSLIFEHGETIKTIDIDIIDDHQFEKDETFMIEFTDLKTMGAKFGRLKKTVVTVVSDDGKFCNVLLVVVVVFCKNFKTFTVGSLRYRINKIFATHQYYFLTFDKRNTNFLHDSPVNFVTSVGNYFNQKGISVTNCQ